MEQTEVYPLSVPKGTKLDCELCGKPGTLQCPYCRVTYYCAQEHQITDWDGIHAKICKLLVPLRTATKILGSLEERKREQKLKRERQVELLEMTRREGHRLLHEGQYELANPASLQSLRFAIELFGSGSIELVPSYLLLGEASIGMKRFKQAEEYLSLAKWAVLKTPDCSDELKSHLYRNFGMLYAAQDQHQEALHQLANDIYFSSCAFGPEHIKTSGGFYQMGNVFRKLRQEDRLTAMYDSVVDAWQEFLVSALNNPDHAELDEADEAEALQMLTRIREVREELFGSEHVYFGEANYALALLFHYMEDHDRAKEHAQTAFAVYEKAVGFDNPTTREIRSLLTVIENVLSPDGEDEAQEWLQQ